MSIRSLTRAFRQFCVRPLAFQGRQVVAIATQVGNPVQVKSLVTPKPALTFQVVAIAAVHIPIFNCV